MSSLPRQFTTWLDLFDHWQTLMTGLIAIVAAGIVVSAPEFFARRRARQEIESIRVALAVEARRLLDTMIETHKALLNAMRLLEEAGIKTVGGLPSTLLERTHALQNALKRILRSLVPHHRGFDRLALSRLQIG